MCVHVPRTFRPFMPLQHAPPACQVVMSYLWFCACNKWHGARCDLAYTTSLPNCILPPMRLGESLDRCSKANGQEN